MIGLAFDTETTGLVDNATMPLNKQPEVIEFYGCLFDDKTGKVVEELDQLIHPSDIKKVTDEIVGITSITREMLKGKPKFKLVQPKVSKLFAKAKFLTGHNLAFDMEILDFEFERLGDRNPFAGPLLCTVEQTVHLRGIRLSLSALHEYLFGEAFAGAHRAKVDVQAQVRCFMELKKRGEL